MFELFTDTPSSSFALILSVILKFGLVILIIVALLNLLRYVKAGFTTTFNKHLQIIETLHLSPKQKIFLIQIDSRTLLISATEENISLLGEVELSDAEKASLHHQNNANGSLPIQPSESFQWGKIWDSLKTKAKVFKHHENTPASNPSAEAKETFASNL